MTYNRDIHILLIEDDDIDQRAFERALKKSNIPGKLTTFVYAKEALELLNSEKINFDCIFIDYQLPDMDGLSLLRKIKESGYSKPVSVMTSQGDENVAVKMMKSGAFDYFPKSELSVSKLTKNLNAILHLNAVSEEKLRIEKNLETQKQFTEAVTRFSPNIIYVYDLDENKFVYTNRSVFQELGYTSQQIDEMGAKIFGLTVHPDHLERISKHIESLALAEDGKIYEVEYQMKMANGNWIWYYNRDIAFKRNNLGKVTQVLGTTTNITNFKKVEHELRIAKQDAERAALVKAEFLSNMSHEIRTPMNAIIGLTDILLSQQHEPFVEENLKSIQHSADNLLVIINDILDFSKIEAGKMVIEQINFDFKYQLDHIEKLIGHKTKQKGLDFQISIDDHIPKYLIGDPFRLNQIILNLAGNAVKFTKIGFVKIAAKLINETGENVEIELSVKDTGIGIPMDKKQSIFESFTQASSNTSRFFGGTGLGLTITNQLVNLMNGTIYVESKVDVGSIFYVNLTFGKGSANKKLTTVKTLKEQSLSGLNILVLEDNKINQTVISQILKSWNCDHSIAENGQIGLQLLAKHNYDIILMDLQMPVLDGFETTKLIRQGVAGTKTKNIPIIALTADAFPETKSKVISTGMNDFVSKPFQKTDLNNKIFGLLNPHR
jgi:PAS domain S-box-containing protein